MTDIDTSRLRVVAYLEARDKWNFNHDAMASIGDCELNASDLRALLDRLEALEQKCILYAASLNQADARLEAAEVHTKWISIDDRMPEDDQTVIVLYWPFDNRENAQIVGQAIHIAGAFYTEDGDDHHHPSHWMHLPAVPALSASEGAKP